MINRAYKDRLFLVANYYSSQKENLLTYADIGVHVRRSIPGGCSRQHVHLIHRQEYKDL